MSSNPYQSPTYSNAPSAPDAPSRWRVDAEDCLLLETNTVLPDRCVVTNVPLSMSDRVGRDLYWTPPVYLIVAFLMFGPLLAVLVHYGMRKHCRLVFALSPEVRETLRRNRRWGTLLLAAGIALLASLAFVPYTGAVVLGVLALWTGSAVFFYRSQLPLRIKKHRDQVFWIAGCSPDFLASLANSN